MRVLIPLIWAPTWVGGVATYVDNLMKGIVNVGIDAFLVQCRETDWQFSRRLFGVFSDDYVVVGNRLAKRAIPEIPLSSLVHTQDPFTTLAIKRHCPAIPVIQTVHGINRDHLREHHQEMRGIKGGLVRMTGYSRIRLLRVKYYEGAGMKAADHLIAVDSNQAKLSVELGVRKDKITIIHNAVDIDRLRIQSINERIALPAAPYFLAARRLCAKNGVDHAVAAFLDWVGDKKVIFCCAGDGPSRQMIEELKKQSPYGEKVVLLGSVAAKQIPFLISNAIATVVPSVPYGGVVEATSLAAIESLALGIHCIASDIGGLSEIDGGRHVLTLVPPGDRNSLRVAYECEYSRYLNGGRSDPVLVRYAEVRYGIEQWIQQIKQTYIQNIKRIVVNG